MDQNPNNNPKTPGTGDEKKKGSLFFALLITVVIVLVITTVYNAISNSQYTLVKFSDFENAKVSGQLAQVQLHADKTLDLLSSLRDDFGRERPEGDRTDQTDLNALLACSNNSILGNTCRDTEGNDAVFRIFHHEGFIHDFIFFDLLVLFKTLEVGLFENFGLQIQRVDDVVCSLALGTVDSPRLIHCLNLGFGKLYTSSNTLTEALRNEMPANAAELFEAVKADYTLTLDAVNQI